MNVVLKVKTPRQVYNRIKNASKTDEFLLGFCCGGIIICVYGAIASII